jgi:DNA-binding MurR/RpiR family transcriptional regulator
VFASSISNHLAALDTAVRRISSKQFGAAVNVLAASRRIVWRGVGPSAHLAAYGQLLSQRVGKPSRALVETGTSFADELLALDRRDAVVVLAYGRLQPHVRVLLDRAEALDVPVVLITDSLARRLGPSVRVTLECGRGAPGLFASHGVTLVVIEALIIAVAARDQTASTDSLRELNELRAALAGRRFDVDAS